MVIFPLCQLVRWQSFFVTVGGGSVFSATAPAAGSVQAIAIGMVPAGLTPVAFFPPVPSQIMPAISVIFLEPVPKKRKKRTLNHRNKEYLHNYDAISTYQTPGWYMFRISVGLYIFLILKLILLIILKKPHCGHLTRCLVIINVTYVDFHIYCGRER